MSAAEVAKYHLGNLFGSRKAQTAARFFITLLLLVLLARTGADLSWQLWGAVLSKSGPAPSSQFQGQVSSPSPTSPRPPVSPPAEEIALFGHPPDALTSPGVENTGIPPASNLNLLLKGVVAVRPMRRALAIIAERGGAAEQLYGQGEEIAPGAVIREIHPDRIIVRRGSVLETLFLESLQPQAPKPPAAVAAQPSRAAGNYLQPKGDGINWLINRDYWTERLADVPGLAREVGVEVYSENNQQKGYRLVAVQNSKLLNNLGLQPGDILLSVNGRAMNNVQEGLAAYQQAKGGGQITIEINRNGRRESRVYNIGG